VITGPTLTNVNDFRAILSLGKVGGKTGDDLSGRAEVLESVAFPRWWT